MTHLQRSLILLLVLKLVNLDFVGTAASEENKDALKVWLRADGGLSFMRKNRDTSYIAYVPAGGTGVRILDTKGGNIFEATTAHTGGSFFWSPDSARLFFRELINKNGKITTNVKAWDAALKKTIDIESIDGSSGLLTFDPRDHRMTLMHDKGIMTKRLVFPDERLAYWQTAQRTEKGKWVASAGGLTLVTQQGFSMAKMPDDDTGIESFDISPNGNLVVWATKYGRIYAAKQGEAAKFIDFGRDPQWHPEKELFVYAGARMVGNKAASFDVKVASMNSPGSFLTNTQSRDERWPFWVTKPDSKGDAIAYTSTGTTDIFTIKFGRESKK